MQIDVDLSRITALIIDDSRYARSFIKTALQSFGIRTILEASDGPSGLEILRGKAVRVGCHERKGRRWGPLVLRQVKDYLAKEVQRGVDASEPGTHAARLGRLRASAPIQFAP